MLMKLTPGDEDDGRSVKYNEGTSYRHPVVQNWPQNYEFESIDWACETCLSSAARCDFFNAKS